MARLNLGKVLVTLEGEHDSSRAYDKYCEVTSGGSSYVSKKAVPIGTLITDTAFWQLRASKGADGQDGTDGNDGLDAYQPFKGWYSSTSDLNTSFGTPQVGDYAYIKGATANDPVAIYQCVTAGTWADSGRTFNPSNNQEFASGQSLNTVNIVDNLTSSSATDVLSAKQGKELKGQIDALGPKIDSSVKKSAGNNLIDPSLFEEGKGIRSSGVIQDLSGARISGFIPVNGRNITSNGYFTSYWGGAVYDSSFAFLRAITESQYTYQSGDAYIRLTFNSSTTGIEQANYGTTLSAYEPYSPIAGYLSNVESKIDRNTSNIDKLNYKIGITSGTYSGSSQGVIAADFVASQGSVVMFRITGTSSATRIILRGNSATLNPGYNIKDNVALGTWYTVTLSQDTNGLYIWVNGSVNVALEVMTGLKMDLEQFRTNALEHFDETDKAIREFSLLPRWVEGSYVNYNTGAIASDSSSFYCDYIKVSAGDVIITDIVIGSGNRGIAFYDATKTFVSGIHTYSDGAFQIPSNCVWMRLSGVTNSNDLNNIVLRKKGTIDAISDEQFAIKQDECKIEIAVSFEQGSFINYSNGNVTQHSSYQYTPSYIRVLPSSVYKTNAYPLNNGGFVFYDKNKNYIGGVNSLTNEESRGDFYFGGTFTTPDGCAFVRMSNYNSKQRVGGFFLRYVRGVDDRITDSEDKMITLYDMMRDVVAQNAASVPFVKVQTSKSFIGFLFDDAESTISDMVSLFADKSLPLCVAVPAVNLINTCSNGSSVKDNMLLMEANGGETMTHWTKPLIATSSEEEIRDTLEVNKRLLIKAGLHPYGAVFAGGGATFPNVAHLKKYLYSTHLYGFFFVALGDNNARFNPGRVSLNPIRSELEAFIDASISSKASFFLYGHALYDVDTSAAVVDSSPNVSANDVYSIDGVSGVTFTVKAIRQLNHLDSWQIDLIPSSWDVSVPTTSGVMRKVSGSGVSTLNYNSFYNGGDWVQKVSDVIDYIRNNYSEGVDFEFVNAKDWFNNTQKSVAELYAESLNS